MVLYSFDCFVLNTTEGTNADMAIRSTLENINYMSLTVGLDFSFMLALQCLVFRYCFDCFELRATEKLNTNIHLVNK
jgi:hypothetical protein